MSLHIGDGMLDLYGFIISYSIPVTYSHSLHRVMKFHAIVEGMRNIREKCARACDMNFSCNLFMYCAHYLVGPP